MLDIIELKNAHGAATCKIFEHRDYRGYEAETGIGWSLTTLRIQTTTETSPICCTGRRQMSVVKAVQTQQRLLQVHT